MTSIAKCLRDAQQRILNSETPRLDAEVLLAHVLQQTRSYLHTWPERELSQTQVAAYDQLIAARAKGQPVAHLLGEREFWSLPLQVNASTLIPRPDTEVLVETCLHLAIAAQASVLDLGTGTGAIALALKSERPQWHVSAVDSAAGAVALARLNAEHLALEVQIAQSDWFAQLSQQRFDLIVSNPPYIAADDPHLQQGDVRFEPLSALVAAATGFADLQRIIDQAPNYLNKGGWLVLEHGWQQAERCREMFIERGFHAVESRRDYANLDRITLGRWETDDVE
ncbi:peptide chain release factor N(5)-glutamine methyltransferase [Pseudidiomarina salilacus]|uniref:peptide chain release factor N(5)-glutamine methyltransferase n=1 Tax=Pseudidiomarina salilacus TaxID=3384452 RepID=UPI003985278C